MRNFVTVFFFSIFSITLHGQAPSIQWQKCYGGTLGDGAGESNSICHTSDGGCIISSLANSNDGDVTGNHGGGDAWIVKINSIGIIQWQKCYGGTAGDIPYGITETNDSGYAFCAVTVSTDGDVTFNHGNADFWVVKINSIGTIIWQKTYGGSFSEYPYSIKQTLDNGYIVAGWTWTDNDGDVSGGHGNSGQDQIADFWVIKIDSIGNLQWQRCLGGTNNDIGRSVDISKDGGYIVTGITTSNNGDVSGLHLNWADAWVVKLDSAGNIQWQHCLGGNDGAEYGKSIIATSDGGYAVTGYTGSTDGDVTFNYGNSDYWIVKLDSGGVIEWQKSLGGSDYDDGRCVRQTPDGGYVVGGNAYSFDGMVTGNHGDDYWVVKLDSVGNFQWEKALGGSAGDYFTSMDVGDDGSIFVYGDTDSNDGDVSGNNGFIDVWLVKLAPLPDGIAVAENSNLNFTAFQNPLTKTIDVSFYCNGNENVSIQLLDLTGRVLLQQRLSVSTGFNKKQVQTGNISTGVYMVRLATNAGAVVKKLMVQ